MFNQNQIFRSTRSQSHQSNNGKGNKNTDCNNAKSYKCIINKNSNLFTTQKIQKYQANYLKLCEDCKKHDLQPSKSPTFKNAYDVVNQGAFFPDYPVSNSIEPKQNKNPEKFILNENVIKSVNEPKQQQTIWHTMVNKNCEKQINIFKPNINLNYIQFKI